MILFLYGKDKFRSLQKLNKIIDRYKNKYKTPLNLRFFNCKEYDFKNFKTQFQTKSMFKEKKLYILKNIFSNPEFQKQFLNNKKVFSESENIILVYEQDNPKKSLFFTFLIKNSKFQKFDLLTNQKLIIWIKKEFAKYETKIDLGAQKLLIEYIGNDLWHLSNEIQKLSSYKLESKIISIQDIKKMLSPKVETKIFKTIDFIAKKEKRKALCMIHYHLKNGDSPLYLLSMITFQFRNLLILKQKLLHKKSVWQLKWHPFVIKKTLLLSHEFTFEQLKKIYRKIAQTDLDIKTGKINPEMALDLLIAAI
ncbi:MAG: DNA polymerase III subunit delta [Candidatus Pacebacteria bacterium]|nr:DNA polymerase III subunit delta [Candidatus Paceibacterota bacterium]